MRKIGKVFSELKLIHFSIHIINVVVIMVLLDVNLELSNYYGILKTSNRTYSTKVEHIANKYLTCSQDLDAVVHASRNNDQELLVCKESYKRVRKRLTNCERKKIAEKIEKKRKKNVRNKAKLRSNR